MRIPARFSPQFQARLWKNVGKLWKNTLKSREKCILLQSFTFQWSYKDGLYTLSFFSFQVCIRETGVLPVRKFCSLFGPYTVFSLNKKSNFVLKIPNQPKNGAKSVQSARKKYYLVIIIFQISYIYLLLLRLF